MFPSTETVTTCQGMNFPLDPEESDFAGIPALVTALIGKPVEEENAGTGVGKKQDELSL